MDDRVKLPTPDAPPARPAGTHDLANSMFGSYRLVRKIAHGGMGVIYEAIQTRLDRKVALKILTDSLESNPEFLQRFEREAKAAAALNHPNIVQVHDFGEADGRYYIVMEYVEGQNLSSYVNIRGKLPVAEALDLIEQAARALKAASEKSIVHRDIKPSNLMITRDGVIKVADLGLAKILNQDSELTMSNIVGSPHFIAPEQALDSRKTDHRVDIYSLGLTLFYLVTAQYPFDGHSPISIVLAHSQKPLPTAAELGVDLPPEVEGLIRRMSAKNADDRYQDYDSLIKDIQLVKRGCAPAAPLPAIPLAAAPTPWPTPTPEPAPTHSRKELVAGIAILAFVLLVAIVSIAVALSRKQAPKTIAMNPSSTTPVETAAAVPATMPPAAESRPTPPDRTQDRFPQPPDGPPDQPGMNEGAGMRLQYPLPMGPPPPPPDANAIPDGPAPAMLITANDYAAKNPTDYMNILFRYRQVQQRAIGTPVEWVVENKLKQWSDVQDRAATDTIKQFETKMRTALANEGAQAAYDVWKNFPKNLRSREIDSQIIKVLQQTLPQDFKPTDRPQRPQ
jgi:serine/threonine protein kinase